MQTRVRSKLALAVFMCLVTFCFPTTTSLAQQSAATPALGAVPDLINYSGLLKDAAGRTRSDLSGVTFLLYKDEQGGTPLWFETQNVTPDLSGHYTVQLGTTSSNGISADLFKTGEARWLAVQIAGEAEQPRVLLVAVPYAMKAKDADTLGGQPASAYMLAPTAPANGTGTSAPSPATAAPPPTTAAAPPAKATRTAPTGTTPVTTAGGTVNFLPLWDSTSDIANSIVFQGTSNSVSRIGINTTTPLSTLDVKGTETVRGNLALPAMGIATATIGYNSQPLTLTASVFNGTAVAQNFRWQAEPFNAFGLTSGTLNLLYASGANRFSETGLSIDPFGEISVIDSNPAATAFFGEATATRGAAWGVEGVTFSGDSNAYGVIGFAPSQANNFGDHPVGVFGEALAITGTGVFGQNGPSRSQESNQAFSAGVWGDNGTNLTGVVAGVIGTADVSTAGFFENNDPTANNSTLVASSRGTADVFEAFGPNNAFCMIDVSANLQCTGTKNAVVPIDGGNRYVAMSAIESPVNWFEDAGSAQLVNGGAVVALDPNFIQTVNTEKEYQVFLTPYGDCRGLYVLNRSAGSFEVHELGGGKATLNFGYRIMAVRKNYENVRFADLTEKWKGIEQHAERLRAGREAGTSRPPRPRMSAKPPIPVVPPSVKQP